MLSILTETWYGFMDVVGTREMAPMIMVIVLFCMWIFSGRPGEQEQIRTILEKFLLYVEGIVFMVICSENKGLKPEKNPDPANMKDMETTTKKIIFIRHGESDWNDIFNKGKNLGLFVRLFKAMWRELKLYPTKDSVFLDSPLNADGIEQAKKLREFIFDKNPDTAMSPGVKEAIQSLRGEGPPSIVVSSNLRRALQTTTVALWPRIEQKGDKISIVSSCQEISRNIDTKALASRKEIPDLSRLAGHCAADGSFDAPSVYDATDNMGNKTTGFTGLKRMKRFNEWAFARKEDTIIVGGHSLWFKSFFKVFLDHSSTHVCKSKKIVNSGVVTFVLHRATDSKGDPIYRVEEDTLEVVDGGFTDK